SEGQHALRRQNDLRPALGGFDSSRAGAADSSAYGRSASASRQPADDGAYAGAGGGGDDRTLSARWAYADFIRGAQVVVLVLDDQSVERQPQLRVAAQPAGALRFRQMAFHFVPGWNDDLAILDER